MMCDVFKNMIYDNKSIQVYGSTLSPGLVLKSKQKSQ